MKSSSLQARDPRVSEERSGTGKRGEIRKLSADGEVSVESSVQPHEQRRLPRSRIQGMGSTELKWAGFAMFERRSHSSVTVNAAAMGAGYLPGIGASVV
jgi:hypothetical protein